MGNVRVKFYICYVGNAVWVYVFVVDVLWKNLKLIVGKVFFIGDNIFEINFFDLVEFYLLVIGCKLFNIFIFYVIIFFIVVILEFIIWILFLVCKFFVVLNRCFVFIVCKGYIVSWK